jgi:hypothetical protein
MQPTNHGPVQDPQELFETYCDRLENEGSAEGIPMEYRMKLLAHFQELAEKQKRSHLLSGGDVSRPSGFLPKPLAIKISNHYDRQIKILTESINQECGK